MAIDANSVVTSKELLLILGLGRSRLSDLVTADVIKKAGHNEYLLAESVQSYIEYKADSDPESDAKFKKHRARKTEHEANKLEHDELVRQGEYDSVANFEAVAERALIDIKAITEETIVQVKAVANLSADEEQEIDKLRIEGFNRIATLYR